VFAFLVLVCGAEPAPAFTVENKIPSAFVVVNKVKDANRDPYGVKDYTEFYKQVEIGPGVLVVGIPDRFVGTYWVHCRVPSGFGGLADGEYLCKLEGGRHVIQPFKWSVDATPEVVAKSTFRQSGIPFNASHNCPVCGRAQYVISGSGPVAGSHTHTCAAGHTWWH
jgi:hypothetical protein